MLLADVSRNVASAVDDAQNDDSPSFRQGAIQDEPREHGKALWFASEVIANPPYARHGGEGLNGVVNPTQDGVCPRFSGVLCDPIE